MHCLIFPPCAFVPQKCWGAKMNTYGIAEVYEDDDCIIIKLKQLLKAQLVLHYCILTAR